MNLASIRTYESESEEDKKDKNKVNIVGSINLSELKYKLK